MEMAVIKLLPVPTYPSCVSCISVSIFSICFKYNIVHVIQTINLIVAVEIVSFLLNNYVYP